MYFFDLCQLFESQIMFAIYLRLAATSNLFYIIKKSCRKKDI